MTKIIVIVFFSILAINISFAQTYVYSDNTNILPEKIEREDKALQNKLFAYFSEFNILKKVSRTDVYKPLIDATIEVNQVDPFKLKVNVSLKNTKRNWYIPRFEEKTIYSEKKLYLIDKSGKIISTFPKWWPQQAKGPNARSVYIPRPENIGLFAKFNKGDIYNLEYLVNIPTIDEDQIIFDLYYLDDSIPTEIFTKYNELNDNHLPYLTTKFNVVKVNCKKVGPNESDGYACDIQ